MKDTLQAAWARIGTPDEKIGDQLAIRAAYKKNLDDPFFWEDFAQKYTSKYLPRQKPKDHTLTILKHFNDPSLGVTNPE